MLVFYLAALVSVVPEHEPWTDEAQAWLLARDASLGDLLWKYLRYEGSPGLWHLLLCVPAKAGLPYFFLNVTGAAAATAGVAVLLFRSPFSWWLRAALPFTYFLAYQYAVVARSYCLVAPLLFAVCALHRGRARHYGWFALALGLLSHVSLHAALLAGAFWVVEALDALRRGARRPPPVFRAQLLGLGILALNFALIIWQVYPPPDIFVRPPFRNLDVSLQLVGLSLCEASVSVGWLSALVWLGVLPLLVQRRVFLLFAGGAGGVLALLCLRYFAYWHTGVLTVFLVAVGWIALAQPASRWRRLPGLRAQWPQRLALGALAILAAVQIRDAVAAAAADFVAPYSSSLEAAEYLREKGIDRRTINALDIHSFAVLPYFSRNIFANYQARLPGSFWIWSIENEAHYSMNGLTEGQPEYLLHSTKPKIRFLGAPVGQIPGYQVERVFAGGIIWKQVIIEHDGLILYRRLDPPVQAPASPTP